jgi:outer membrane protein
VLADVGLEPLDPDLERWTSRALAQRAELAQLAAQSESLRHQAERLLAANRPHVDLRGGYSYLENRYQTPEGIGAVGIGVHWSLYDGGKTRRQADAAHHEAESLARLRRDLESKIRLQVRQAWLQAHETRQRMQLTQDVIAHAEENHRLRADRYRTGMGTSTELLEAEAFRLRSYRDHSAAYYAAVLAMLRLRRAAGDL